MKEVIIRKKKSNVILYIMTISLILLLISGLYGVYDKGYYDGMKEFCDLDIGINQRNEYVCYNEELLTTVNTFNEGGYFNVT